MTTIETFATELQNALNITDVVMDVSSNSVIVSGNIEGTYFRAAYIARKRSTQVLFKGETKYFRKILSKQVEDISKYVRSAV